MATLWRAFCGYPQSFQWVHSIEQREARFSRRARAQAPAERAEAFIKDFGDKLVAVVNGSGTPQAKRPKLTAIVEKAVDLDGVALFCLGRYWRSASSEQQGRYTALFHQVLVTNILAKLGEYQGVHFTT